MFLMYTFNPTGPTFVRIENLQVQYWRQLSAIFTTAFMISGRVGGSIRWHDDRWVFATAISLRFINLSTNL
jgi:hypothetical protein